MTHKLTEISIFQDHDILQRHRAKSTQVKAPRGLGLYFAQQTIYKLIVSASESDKVDSRQKRRKADLSAMGREGWFDAHPHWLRACWCFVYEVLAAGYITPYTVMTVYSDSGHNSLIASFTWSVNECFDERYRENGEMIRFMTVTNDTSLIS